MRLNLFKVWRIVSGFLMCYSILLIRDYLSPDRNTRQRIFQSLMEERVSNIEQQCHNKTLRPNIKTGDNLYVLPEQKLIWCPVFKAASTNWMYNLLPLAGLDQNAIDFIRLIF